MCIRKNKEIKIKLTSNQKNSKSENLDYFSIGDSKKKGKKKSNTITTSTIQTLSFSTLKTPLPY